MKGLLKAIIVGLILFLAIPIQAQIYQKFPTNVRYIAGGYNDKRPFFKTLEAALNDVKPYATASNPYTFWIASDTLWIADWDSVFTSSGLTIKDSINIYYVNTGKITWMPYQMGQHGPGTIFGDSLVNIFDKFVFANNYLNSGGIPNDSATTAVMFKAAIGKTLVFSDSIYMFDSRFDINLRGNKIVLDLGKSILYSSAYITNDIYYVFHQTLDTGIPRPSVGDVYGQNSSYYVVIDTIVTEYILTQKISGTTIPTTSGSIVKFSGSGASSYTYSSVTNGQYYLPAGAFRFTNGEVEINGGQWKFYNDGSFTRDVGEYFDGLIIDSCTSVQINNSRFANASHINLRILNSQNVMVQNTEVDSCALAGISFTNVKRGEVFHNYIHDIGYNPPIDGYGFTASSQFGTYNDNEDIVVQNNTIERCARKAIDFHGGININISKNFISGFGFAGIYAVNGGSSEHGHYFKVRDVIIDGNYIEQDSTWLNTFNIPYWSYGGGVSTKGIQFGSYNIKPGQDRYPYGGGTFKCINNTLRHLTSFVDNTLSSVFGIDILSGTSEIIQVSGNSIDSSYFWYAVTATGGNGSTFEGQPTQLKIHDNSYNEIYALGRHDIDVSGRIIYIAAGKYIDIYNETITNSVSIDASSGDSGSAIEVNDYTTATDVTEAKITNCSINGTFAVPTRINTGDTRIEENNTWNKIKMINYHAKDEGSYRTYSGELNFLQAGGEINDTISLFSVDGFNNGDTTSSYRGSLIAEIEIYSSSAVLTGTVPSYTFKSSMIARISNDSTAIDTAIYPLEHIVYEGAELIPVAYWSGTGNVRTLQIALNTHYNTFAIDIKKFVGYKLKPENVSQ